MGHLTERQLKVVSRYGLERTGCLSRSLGSGQLARRRSREDFGCSYALLWYPVRVISQESIDRVRNEASIVEVVSETVKLRRTGANHTGLCPFHSERSPSFSVRESNNSYHCFGCGASGNVISFVMNTRALSFPDAVEFLASRFGIELKYESGRAAGPKIDREKLFSLCHTAHSFFRRSLMQVKNGQGEYQKVGEYLRKRGLTAEAINTFGIGYAPNQKGALLDVLTKAGYDRETILLSGLVRRAASGDLYELFRGRLLFPIFIDPKRIAGFGGRVIPGVLEPSFEKQAPKYVNSPETPIYQKSKTFYGLPQAMGAVRECGEVYIVEGYMDVIGLAMRGVRNVVACCGTALTEQHIKRLSGMCSRVHLLFDGDEAGINAAAKSFSVARNADLDVTACFLPEDTDPDDFAAKHGDHTEHALRDLPKALLIDSFIDGVLRKLGCGSGEVPGPNLLGKVCDEVAKALAGVQREVVRASLMTRAARRLRIETVQLEKLVDRHRDGLGRSAGRAETGLSSQVDSEPVEDQGSGMVGQATRGSSNRQPSQLPKSDLALLRVVMVLREAIISQVINNAELCEMLQPESIRFILGLGEIVDRPGLGDEQAKGQIKQYLQGLGGEWVGLWKEAHAMVSMSEESPEAIYAKTLGGFKREKLSLLIRESQQEMVSYGDDPQRQAEVFERIKVLKSQLDSVVRG
jgi:DNA primase